jgi:nitroreductase
MTDFVTAPELTVLEHLVMSRRTSLRIDPDRPVPATLLDRLIRLVCWAPNHKRTWPWRIAVVSGQGRHRLGELIGDYEARRGSDPARVAKAAAKYLRAPVVALFSRAACEDPARWTEDRDAVAAGVQNLLLGATAAGLASHWATGGWMDDAAVKEYLELAPEDEIVALVYLGWPIDDVPVPERPVPSVTYRDA